jgi:ankyrin repeat protein
MKTIHYDDAGVGRWAGMTELHVAAFLDDEEAVVDLVSAGAEIEARSRYDYPSMPDAYALVSPGGERKRLAEQGVNVDGRLLTDATPLMLAAGHADSVAALKLIALGADVRAVEKTGSSALHFAAEAGNLELCRALIAAGAKPDLARSSFGADGARPLHLAAKAGHAAVCSLLLKAGAKLHSMDLNSSPLHWAAKGGHLEACKVLVSHGADPTYREHLKTKKSMFHSPLTIAMEHDRVHVVRYFLLECEADPQAKTAEGTKLETLARTKGRLDIVKLIGELTCSAETTRSVSKVFDVPSESRESAGRSDRSMSPL